MKSHRPLFLSEKILDNIDHEVDLIQQRREAIREQQASLNRSRMEAAWLYMNTAFRFRQNNKGELDQSVERQARTTRSSASLLGAYVNLERDDRKKRAQSIDIQHVVNSMIKDHQGIENTRRVFNEIDVDCDGVISLDEFIAAYQKIDAGTSEEHLQKMFEEADVDDSGKLSFDEFLRVARIPNLLAELGTKNRDSRGLIQVQASKEQYFGEELRMHSTPGVDSFAMSRSQHFSMELYESRIASLQQFVAMTVMFHQIGYRVQSFFPKVSFGMLGYRMDRTHSIMRIATTASPVSGADVRERMEELRLMLKIERSVQLICRTWKKWKMERKDDLRPAGK